MRNLRPLALIFLLAALAWHAAGATLIGGCCRTGPEHIRRMRDALHGEPPAP